MRSTIKVTNGSKRGESRLVMKWNSGNSHRVGPAETETSWVDAKMQSAAEYRRYAAECERIARDSAPSHRAVLLDIAKAWRDCAVEAERQENVKAVATDCKAAAIDGKGVAT